MATARDQKILILTQDVDPHVDVMVVELQRRGADCIRWHPHTLSVDSSVSMVAESQDSRAELNLDGKIVRANQVRSVWSRRPDNFVFPSSLSNDERLFAEREMNALVHGFLRWKKWFWVNHPDRTRFASSKALQLQAARRLGLKAPRTLISNDPTAIASFIRTCGGGAVYKTLSSPFLGNQPIVCYTSMVNEEHLQHIDVIRSTGGIFQEFLPKQFDIRVTVFGNRVFAARIYSQELTETRVDFRAADPSVLRHEPHDLPVDLQQKCVSLLRLFRLVYSAIDFVLTPSGEYVFLEINPAGQFGWVEELTGVPLTGVLADMLIAGKAY